MPRSHEGVDVPPIAQKKALQDIRQIVHQVEPIDNLDRLWGSAPNPLSIELTPIAADTLDAGIRLQPIRDRGGRALGEEIHHLMALKVAENGPETSALPLGPFIEPSYQRDRQEQEGRTMD
jgi:hypothetical protein